MGDTEFTIAELRAATLGKSIFRKEMVDFNGKQFEIREPTTGELEKIRRGARIGDELDSAKLAGMAIICLVRHPKTGEPIFTESDMEAIMNSPAGGFVDVLGKACIRVMTGQEADERPTIDATTSMTSAS